jgi:His-Xaa-Ser system protein HxsD
MAEPESASAFQIGSDELGVFVRVRVDPAVYSEVAVLKTAYWLTDQHYLFITTNPSTGLLEVELRLKEGSSQDKLRTACGEFLNSLLDSEVRQRVLGETAEVRGALIRKAFFEARLPLPSTTISDES